ncbi:MAG: PEP-utilizing enzyme, partial [Firmicutes bacterium]|nr:PEP-utilizing enzyme [Bacillota bacterium]
QEEFKNFVCVHYLKNEYNYFWQAFVNIVRISIYKKSALKIVSKEEYFGLLSGLDDVSHTRPFVRLSEYEKDIKSDKDAYEFWTNTPVDKIIEFYHINPKNNKLDFIDKFNKEFGYHSFKELDLAYPDFYENPIYAVKFLKESLAFTTDTLNNAYIKQCESIKQRLSGFKYKKLIRQTKTIRKFLWWREEFKDLSTRYYSLVRKFALKLADKYFKSGILKDKGDIFHLKFSDIFDFFDNKIDAEQLRQIICKNKVYFDSFVNYKIPNQIGAVDDLGAAAFASAHNKFTPKASVLGVGCGGGTAQGTARVVKTPSDLDKVCLGEIIVAGHFEAGFISKFKVIGGIITETGGALCHSSIIAREYNLPAIVSACDITKIVKTGDTIQINASTGEIKVIKHLKSN